MPYLFRCSKACQVPIIAVTWLTVHALHALQPLPGVQCVCDVCIRNRAGEPCSRASLLMLGSMTVVYIALFLPQLKSCLALYPAVRLAFHCQSQVL